MHMYESVGRHSPKCACMRVYESIISKSLEIKKEEGN